jgi:hypothetical protein
MKQFESFRVRVDPADHAGWSQTFVGRRPTKGDILVAIADDGVSLKTTLFEPCFRLVRDHLLPDDTIRICPSATGGLGRIEIQSREHVIMLEGADE